MATLCDGDNRHRSNSQLCSLIKNVCLRHNIAVKMFFGGKGAMPGLSARKPRANRS